MLEIFDELETKRKSTRNGIPRQEGELLYTFIKEHNIKRVVETGIEWGFTSYYILAALPDDGELISVEINKANHIGSVVPSKWRHKWTIVYGASKLKLQKVFLLNPDVDLFFHDSNHFFETQTFEYETAFPFVKFIGSHDIHLYGPVFAWDKFIERHKLRVLISQGQLGIAQIQES
jgi:hypothetical protein